jgi:hypothetical protein
VARGEQFVDRGGADPSGGSSDENAHDVISFDAPLSSGAIDRACDVCD